MRRVVFLLAPRWLALHIAVAAAGITMVLLGRWQWRVAHVHHGSVQNYAYAFQWWAFTAFAVVMWLRVMRDGVRRRADLARDASVGATGVAVAEPAAHPAQPVAYRRYVMPTSSSVRPQVDDPELNAYNAYLAELAERGDATGREDGR